MKLIYILILTFILSAGLSLATSYNADQQTAFEGYKLSFQLGQEYQKIMIQGGSATAFNALIEQWNAFVIKNYGNDTNLLMKPLGADSANLRKPYAVGKNITNNGMIHSIDASGKYGPSWTTNDVNALPDSARLAYQASDTGKTMGDGYLSGV